MREPPSSAVASRVGSARRSPPQAPAPARRTSSLPAHGRATRPCAGQTSTSGRHLDGLPGDIDGSGVEYQVAPGRSIRSRSAPIATRSRPRRRRPRAPTTAPVARGGPTCCAAGSAAACAAPHGRQPPEAQELVPLPVRPAAAARLPPMWPAIPASRESKRSRSSTPCLTSSAGASSALVAFGCCALNWAQATAASWNDHDAELDRLEREVERSLYRQTPPA